MSDVVRVLTEARDLISDPKRWTQGAYARDAHGRQTYWGDPAAVCWCASGAISKATKLTPAQSAMNRDLVDQAQAELDSAIDHYGVFTFNDSRTHKEVLEMFDRAIAGKEA